VDWLDTMDKLHHLAKVRVAGPNPVVRSNRLSDSISRGCPGHALSPGALGEDRYVVFTRLTGNFPGGTAELANRFTLRGGLIANLEVAPPAPGEEPDASRSG
jgi:hypothetical protein